MKRALCLLLAILLLLSLCACGEKLADGTAVRVTIPEGATGSTIAEILKENGLISSERKFLSAVKDSEYDGRLQAGEFELVAGSELEEIIEGIATGSAHVRGEKLTVPEGFSAELIAKRVDELGFCTEAEFLAALSDDYDYEFLSEIPDDEAIKYPLQGFLFPSTYEVTEGMTAHEIVDRMLAEFARRYEELSEKPEDGKLYEVLTKASLIERESALDSERATIAGVIENRLKIDMPLQIDATVIYAVSDGLYDMSAVYYSHLEEDSPYNTYKYKGIPAGPICNPGLLSIQAAISPQSHDYLYYHTDEQKKDGSHIFTKTFDEHKATM